MDPKFTSKELCCTVIDVLTLGLAHERIEDADAVLTCLRAMRPRVAEFDTFEAWIWMKRGFYKDAIRLLRTTSSSSYGGAQAKALMAYCQFASGDSRWSDVASQVLEADLDEDSSRLMRLLIDPDIVAREQAADLASTTSTSRMELSVGSPTVVPPSYMRA